MTGGAEGQRTWQLPGQWHLQLLKFWLHIWPPAWLRRHPFLRAVHSWPESVVFACHDATRAACKDERKQRQAPPRGMHAPPVQTGHSRCRISSYLWEINRGPLLLCFRFGIGIPDALPLQDSLCLSADRLTTCACCPQQITPAANIRNLIGNDSKIERSIYCLQCCS
jgi:hypothetical protein